MEKYNDFALPSLENIEQMAKAFKDLDVKKTKNESNVKNRIVAQDQMQLFYFEVQKICAIVDFLYAKYAKNEQVNEIFENVKRIKNKVDGMVLDFRVEELKDFTVAENTALQDLCASCAKCVRIGIANLHILEFKDITNNLLDLIEIVCKY